MSALRAAIDAACASSAAAHDASVRRERARRVLARGISGRDDPTYRALDREYLIARDVYSAHLAVVRKLFAESRGWTPGKRFTLRMLRAGSPGRTRDDYYGESFHPVIDHAEYFRLPRRPWRPAAIVSHTYAPPAQILTFAAEHGLAAEFLEQSWYFAGATTAVVFTAAVGGRA